MLEANPLALLPLLCCAVALRVVVLSHRRAPGLALAALGAAAWNASIAAAACLTEPEPMVWLARIATVGALAIGAGELHFLTELTRHPRRRLWLAVGFSATAAAMLLALLNPRVFPAARPVPWGGFYGVAGSHFVVPLAVAAGQLCFPMLHAARVWLRTPRSRRRRQLAHVMSAFVVMVLGSVNLAAVYGRDLPPIGWATSIISLSMLYGSVAKLRLVNARTAFSRTRFWLIFMVLTFAPLLGVLDATEGWPGWHSPVARVLALAALWLVGLRIERLVSRTFEGSRAEGAARIRAFAAATRAPSAPVGVLAPLGRALEASGLDLVAAALSIDVGDGPPDEWDLLRIGEPAVRSAPPAAVPDEIVARDDLEPGAGHAWLDAFAGDMAIPLRTRREKVGVLVARLRDADHLIDDETRELVARLATQAAVAFTNATLHDRLARRAARLVREVEERTRSLEQANAERRAAQAQLVQAERQSALGLLVAGVSHEVNNALNFIYANAPVLVQYAGIFDELFARAGDEPAARAAAARLRDGAEAVAAAARRTRVLVEDLRRFARSDDTERRPLDVRQTVSAAMKLVTAHLRRRSEPPRVLWQVAAAPEGAYVVEAYPTALHHAVLSLALNAAQAVGEGGTITLELGVNEHAVRLSIVDDGPGIPEADRERMFEPFVTTRPGATGLGLTTARATAERHGGSLVIEENAAGAGTRLVLTLPARGAAS